MSLCVNRFVSVMISMDMSVKNMMTAENICEVNLKS